jgi:hypothetical protein
MTKRAWTFSALILLLVFSLSVLTVETHSNHKGTFASRLPTFLEQCDDIAVESSPGVFSDPAPLQVASRLSFSSFHVSRLDSPFHINRAPPSA